ncbi:MAG: hypothetical protein A2X67_00610 [Ignavibacteria bacterium GWA2_55_11]|nr:MAG: hypothetical protein A2X67_00610 [Ignavibacteria bacterium GWA2_55_11]OGU66265.1 MAG: hypothetical protein A3C56_13450 [Ignavibacteria bacterium RIFCSPHIGHO2_02_FULL_56_12]OGU72074.1 MAG: hypothetical protein A3G43_09150 [Ignavibacteria bacterium RIFCSPLOWO2_12_FULL_56_21]
MRTRLTFLDLLRSWAALVMIEVHVVNAFLLADYREQGWFTCVNYVNGLVAPAFLFVAGFAFAFTAERPLATAEEKRAKLFRQLRRIGLILAAGYVLHLPGFGWTKVSQATQTEWLKFFQADILHCIAVGLLILVAAREYLGGARGVLRMAAVVGSLSVLVAPWTWTYDAQAMLPVAIAAYVNGTPFSQFPLFPWLAFMMAGAVVAGTYPRDGSIDQVKTWVRRVGLWGLAVFVVTAIARWPDWAIGLPGVNIRVNPWFVAERVGVLLVLVWSAAQWSFRHAELSPGLRDVSRETLFVYFVHLMVIYGDWFDGHSLAFLYKQHFGIIQTVAAVLALMAVMTAASWAWQRSKEKSDVRSRYAFYFGVAVCIGIFFAR